MMTKDVREVIEAISRTESRQSQMSKARAAIAVQAGARNVEGPAYEEARDYAAFFEYPSGNRLEICYREHE